MAQEVAVMVGRIQRELWEVALDQDGYVTTHDARRLGINVVELGKLAHRNQLQRVAHSIYRFAQLPPSEFAPYMLAVLWADGRAVLAHATAIGLYELADVNPDRIHLTVPPGYRPRRKGGDLYTVHHQHLDDGQVRHFEQIPIVTPAVAIDQILGDGTPGHLIRQAIATARNRGQITTDEQQELDARLEART